MASPSLVIYNFSLSLLLTFLLIIIKPSNASLSKTEMIKQVLEGHNKARKAVGVPPLKWDQSLSNYARVYSNKRRGDCKLVHSPGYAFGENLFWGQGKRWSPADAILAWVAEQNSYNYGSDSCTAETCSHYTQIVWLTTERVGCSKIVCNSGDSFIACEYFPPGNYIGVRPY